MPEAFFTEPTTGYWQDITAEIPSRFSDEPPYRYGYPVRMPDGRVLVLPLRQLPSGDRAVASLIANQAAHDVIAVLADAMTQQARVFDAGIVVGLPTLGLAFASLVAERLGHPRFVPLGYSRKFWYDDALSEAVRSITSPDVGKRLRLDPNMLPLLERRRVVLVDDAISSGATAVAAISLLQRIGAQVAGIVVAMKQTNRWEAEIAKLSAPPMVRAVYGCPLFRRGDDGWWPLAETQPGIP
ncbi:MAG: phosphoribosyltransferase [Pseudorhodoplanes sp.]|nr:phosphoribosyltransferase [Pseudorhodoplanes sp.]